MSDVAWEIAFDIVNEIAKSGNHIAAATGKSSLRVLTCVLMFKPQLGSLVAT